MNKFIQVATMAAIGVVLIVSLLLPIVDNSTAETRTYNNEGVPFVLMDDQEHTMIITNNDGVPSYTVDGVDVNAPEYLFNNQSTVIYGEDGLLRVWLVGDTTRLRVQAGALITQNLNDGESATITFDSTNVSFNSKTSAIKPLAYLGNGTYSQLVKPCVLDESVIYIAGITENIGNVPSNYIALVGSGTIENLDLAVVSYTLGEGVTVTSTEYEVTTSTVDGDLKKIENIMVTFTMSDNTTHTANYTYFIAPASITYDNPDLVNSDMAALFNLLPLLCVIGLVLGIIAYAIRARLN